MKFWGHGSIEFEQINDVVYVKYIGTINLETYRGYAKKILAIAKEYNGKPWAEVQDFTTWELSPPDVITQWVEDEKNPDKIKYRCSDVLVIANQLFIENHLRTYSKNEVFLEPDFLKTKGEAIKILKEKGYNPIF